jgi:hypothetical protein
MKHFHRSSFVSAVLGLAILPWLVACGGQGGADKSAEKSPADGAVISCAQYNAVTSGFTGDLNSEGAQGGDPGGGDASGSAGVGGGLGKVLGAKVEVVRLSDGLKFNSQDVVTDRVTGLVRVQTCDVRQPLLITLTGVEGATYYDEGKNALLPFGPDQEIHALVDKIDGNIGVSALTEAAYRYAINHFLADPQAIANGSSPLLKRAGVQELSKLTADQIATANQRVVEEVNRVLPANYKLASITALPTPLGLDNQSTGLLPPNRYGQAAIVTGAFSWMADKFRIGTSRPTLDMLEELARDLTDGKLNGLALGGALAASGSASTYDSVNIPINLNVGANFIAEHFSDVSLDAASRYVDVTAFQENMSCNTTWNRFALTKQGTIELNRQRFKSNDDDPAANNCVEIGAPIPDPEFTRKAGTNVKEIFTAHNTGGGFFVKDDGKVFSWGNSVCGQLANGEWVGIRYEPKAIAGLSNVTSLANGSNFSIARDNDGHVYSWGSSKFGVLGLGSGPLPNAVPCANPRFGDSVLQAAATPRRVPGLDNITHVFVAYFSKVFALDKAGQLYNWGFGCGRQGYRTEEGIVVNTGNDTPQRLSEPTSVRAVAANVRGCFALKTDGTLVGWGFHNGVRNDEGTFDDGQWFGDGQATAKVRPTALPGLTDVREIASDENYFYALKSDGTLWRWGGSLDGQVQNLKTPTQLVGIAPIVPGGEVRFRHIKSDPDGARFFAQDGRIFVLKPWKNPVHNTVDAVEFWGFKN